MYFKFITLLKYLLIIKTYFQINSIFGKTCENPRLYKTLKLITTEKNAKKEINKKEFESYTTINPNLVVAELKKDVIKLCKPIYTGMVI